MVAHIIAARIENFEHNRLPKNVRVHSPAIAAPIIPSDAALSWHASRTLGPTLRHDRHRNW
jgi:hypothetical protein